MSPEEIAKLSHKTGHSCAESVYTTFAEAMGIEPEAAARLAPKPRSEGGKCGAFLAGKKVIEQLKPDLAAAYEERFEELNGSSVCAVLIASHSRLHKKCNDYVGDAARICDELLKQS